MCCRFYIIMIIVAFYPNGCTEFENPEVSDFQKIASAFGSFLTLSLPTSFIKVLPLPQKFNCFHFQLALLLPHPCFKYHGAKIRNSILFEVRKQTFSKFKSNKKSSQKLLLNIHYPIDEPKRQHEANICKISFDKKD